MKKVIVLFSILIILIVYVAIPSESSKLIDMGFKSYNPENLNILNNFGEYLDHSMAKTFGKDFTDYMKLGDDGVSAHDKIVVTTSNGKTSKSMEVYFISYFPYKNEVYVYIKTRKGDKYFKIEANQVEIKKI